MGGLLGENIMKNEMEKIRGGELINEN